MSSGPFLPEAVFNTGGAKRCVATIKHLSVHVNGGTLCFHIASFLFVRPFTSCLLSINQIFINGGRFCICIFIIFLALNLIWANCDDFWQLSTSKKWLLVFVLSSRNILDKLYIHIIKNIT